MGKTPKKAAPGGDERNLYVRRLKATTAPSKASETSLPVNQRESESSNRHKYGGLQKKIASGQVKGFKSKLESPSGLGLGHPPKRLGRPPGSTNKKKHFTPVKSSQAQTSSMQPDSEDAEVKTDALNRKETVREENAVKTVNEPVESVPEKDETSDVLENSSPSDDRNGSIPEDRTERPLDGRSQDESDMTDSNLEEHPTKESREREESEGNGIKLALETEENEPSENNSERKEEQQGDETQACQKESQGVTEKEEHNGSQTDTESCSVDIVESTTSEISETSESPAQTDPPKDKDQSELKSNNNASFISYDSSIMLKDVKIKLNDCLKDNSKMFEPSNADDSAPNTPNTDMSFGKTLRNISGRHSLSRMRHVTLREHRFSPNSSMYVNISSASLQPNETTDVKVLHYRSGLDESSVATNGTPAERKRKLDSEAWYSAKKQKTESENNLLNASLGLLKGVRKPVQVSTPNVHAQKYHSTNLDMSEMSDDGVPAEQADGARKWCIIM